MKAAIYRDIGKIVKRKERGEQVCEKEEKGKEKQQHTENKYDEEKSKR